MFWLRTRCYACYFDIGYIELCQNQIDMNLVGIPYTQIDLQIFNFLNKVKEDVSIFQAFFNKVMYFHIILIHLPV